MEESEEVEEDWEIKDSEYYRLENEISRTHPPTSMRVNVPLNDYQEKMPQWFKDDEQCEVGGEERVPVLKPRTEKKQQKASPARGGIRLCRVLDEHRIDPYRGFEPSTET